MLGERKEKLHRPLDNPHINQRREAYWSEILYAKPQPEAGKQEVCLENPTQTSTQQEQGRKTKPFQCYLLLHTYPGGPFPQEICPPVLSGRISCRVCFFELMKAINFCFSSCLTCFL